MTVNPSNNNESGEGAEHPFADFSDEIATALGSADAAVRNGAADRAETTLLSILERVDSAGPGPRAVIEFRLGRLLFSQGRTDDAAAWFETALYDARRALDTNSEALALNGLAAIAQRRGELDRADELWEATCALAADNNNHRLVAMASQNRGVLSNIRGDFGSAMGQYRRSLRSFESAEDDQGVAWVANNLGMLLADLRRFPDALTMFRLASAHATAAVDLEVEGLAEGNLAATLVEMGQSGPARAPAMRALTIARQRKDILREAEVRRTLGVLHRGSGDLDGAHSELSEAYDLAVAASDKLLTAELLVELGELSFLAQHPEKATLEWGAAESIFREIGASLDAEDLAERRVQRVAVR